jgi:hypothetical protein
MHSAKGLVPCTWRRDRTAIRLVGGTTHLHVSLYRVFRAQADWTFILTSELPAKVLRHLPRKCRREAPPTEKSDKPAVAFFSPNGAGLS